MIYNLGEKSVKLEPETILFDGMEEYIPDSVLREKREALLSYLQEEPKFHPALLSEILSVVFNSASELAHRLDVNASHLKRAAKGEANLDSYDWEEASYVAAKTLKELLND